MFVGICRLTFQLHDVHSLKSKRSVVSRLVERTRSKFSVSVAEVGDNDVHQRAVIAFSVVGNESPHVHTMLSTIAKFMEQMEVAPLLRRETEVIPLGESFQDTSDLENDEVPQMTEEDFS